MTELYAPLILGTWFREIDDKKRKEFYKELMGYFFDAVYEANKKDKYGTGIPVPQKAVIIKFLQEKGREYGIAKEDIPSLFTDLKHITVGGNVEYTDSLILFLDLLAIPSEKFLTSKEFTGKGVGRFSKEETYHKNVF